MMYRCYASCAFGIEGILAEEMRRLGLPGVSAQDARVYFDADETAIARANIFLRTADRIYIVLAEFDAVTFEELFESIKHIRFADFLPSDARMPVGANAVKSALMSVSDIQAVSKKAIIESLRRSHQLTRFPENGNVFHVFVNILKNRVTVGLNTSGAGLNRRGYRLKNVQAPLKETLAAALLLIARWHARDFYDPFCGSGTIPIEAAMLAMDMAPGIKRRFDAQNYNNDFRKSFAQMRENARAIVRRPEMPICASDVSAAAVKIAKEHAHNMDVAEHIRFDARDVARFAVGGRPASIVTNPPYAVRIGEKTGTERLYETMGEVFRRAQDTLAFVICANDQFERFYGMKADKKRKLYNGNLQCTFYQYFRRKNR